MAKIKVNSCYTLRYNSREDDSGDTIVDLAMDFDNPKDHTVVAERLNTWLTAIGLNLEVIEKVK